MNLPAAIDREFSQRDARAMQEARNRHVDLRAVEASSNGDGHGGSPVLPVLDPAALHGLAGDFIAQIGPQTEADPASMLTQFLALFGNVIGRSAYFPVEGTRHHTNIFVLIIGQSSKSRKGTSLTYAQRIFERVDEQHASDCSLTGVSSGEGMIAAVRDQREEKKPIKEKGGRITDYQTEVIDHGVTDKRAMVLETEFASVIARMGRDGSSTSAVLRQAWDGAHKLKVMTRNNPVTATDAHVSLIGHITKDELIRNLDATEKVNGFLNRFLLVCSPPRTKLLPLGGRVSDSVINGLVREASLAVKNARQVSEMCFDDEARELWFTVYPKLSEGKPGMLGAVTSRSEAYVLRLACIYALLDAVPIIEPVHLKAALALWAYCEDSARYVFGNAIGDRVADDIAAALRDADVDGMSRTAISNLFNRNVDKDRINIALRLLSDNGIAFSRSDKGEGNKSVERWFITKMNGTA